MVLDTDRSPVFLNCATCGDYTAKEPNYCNESCEEKYILCYNCHKPTPLASQSHYCSAECKVVYRVEKLYRAKKYVPIIKE